MWQTWLPGHKAPRWALEIVSDDWKKDYEENPLKYAHLGTRELVIFNPHAADVASSGNGNGNGSSVATRVRLQVYRRDADGAFVRTYHGDGPARSEELDAWVLCRREEGMAIPRLARDAAGTDPVPTEEDATRAAEEARRAAEAKLAEEADARRRVEERLLAMEEELRTLRG